MALLDIGRAADAVACLNEAVACSPKDVAYREALAQALVANGDLDAAMRVLLEGIAIVPGASATRNAAILLCIRPGRLRLHLSRCTPRECFGCRMVTSVTARRRTRLTLSLIHI